MTKQLRLSYAGTLKQLLIPLMALFVILYFQDRIFIYEVSLSNVWRVLFYLVIFSICLISSRIHFENWQRYFILFLLYYPIGVSTGMTEQVLDALLFFIPILAGYYGAALIEKYTRLSAFYVLHIISSFLILTSLPFLLGLIDAAEISSFDQLRITRKFGSDLEMFVGFFKHPALAGKAICFALAIMIFSLLNRRYASKVPIFAQYGLILLGGFVLYAAFVRASWIAFILIMVIGVLRYQNTRYFALAVFGMVVAGVYLADFSLIYNRLIAFTGTGSSFDLSSISSGRTDIWVRILGYQADNSIASFFLGLGGEGYAKAAGDAYAHNMYIQGFAHSGLVGLFLGLMAGIHVWRDLKRSKSPIELKRFAIGLSIAFLFYGVTSHGLEFWSGIIFGGMLYLATQAKSFEISPLPDRKARRMLKAHGAVNMRL